MEFRQANLPSHATVLPAIGSIGADLMWEHPTDWKAKVAGLIRWE